MSEASMSPTMQEAIEAHRQGFPTRAIPIYERVLAETPDDARALSLYGLALLQAGRPSEAETPLRRAVELQPNDPGYKSGLAELYFKTGDDETALAELGKVTAAHPDFAPAFIRLGDARMARQEYAAAAEAFDSALQLTPGDLRVAQTLARALAAIENYGAAYHVLDHAEKIMPDNINTLKIRLEIARTRRDFSAMHTIATQITKLAPEEPVGWRDLATTLFEAGIYGDAMLAFEKALSISGRDAITLGQLASIAIQALDFEKAEAAINEAEALAPHDARVLSTKALLLTYQGKRDEALDYCERCMRADPDFVGVYPQLSLLRNGKLMEDEEKKIRAYAERSDVAPAGRATARFVTAHNFEARSNFDAAFDEYERANAIAAERNRNDQIFYDPIGHSAWTDAIISVFDRAPENVGEAGSSEPQPIFIVGLPRCGSTLVESVIAAHSSVQPGGEMPMMPNLFNKWFRENYQSGPARLSAEECESLAAGYMKGAPTKIENERFTDKNLLNIESAAFIAHLFPQAKIINVRRNPVENAFAIWRQDMMKFWSFATSFEDLAQRYGLYAKLVAHFEKILEGRFHTIQYEDFASDFPNQSRKLIELCGLDWEDACGDFQKARNVAPTISAMQVRQEVSLKGGRASSYGARLDPLRRALDEAGVDIATGAIKP